MAVKIGTVSTFADVKPDKAQAVKILEESAEVFSALEQWEPYNIEPRSSKDLNGQSAIFWAKRKEIRKKMLVDECADVIQAVCNLLTALGVDDLTAVLDRCKQKNVKRGREYERHSSTAQQ